MKQRLDWADKAVERLRERTRPLGRDPNPGEVLKIVRAAERRGFSRAVKMLREPHENDWYHKFAASWLEEQKP